jgi:16S rRNA (adenine1518-N6/adenine1519-N6)-dimethyltransferase
LNLADPVALKALLARHGISAEKGLGQHFLISEKVVSRIAAAFEGYAGLLEIGPGPGVLTSHLSSSVSRLVALEVDDRMLPVVAESSPSAEVRREDALRADLSSILAELPEPRGLVSNLPYYITGPLVTRVAEARRSYSKAVLMMQKEVAERVVAEPKTSARGSLSVFLQSQFKISLICNAPAGAFLPPPKVDSRVLEFVPREMPVPQEEEREFFRLIRQGFVQPRKTLVNNLVGGLHLVRDDATAVVEAAGLGPNARPQELSLEEWVRLHQAILPRLKPLADADSAD